MKKKGAAGSILSNEGMGRTIPATWRARSADGEARERSGWKSGGEVVDDGRRRGWGREERRREEGRGPEVRDGRRAAGAAGGGASDRWQRERVGGGGGGQEAAAGRRQWRRARGGEKREREQWRRGKTRAGRPGGFPNPLIRRGPPHTPRATLGLSVSPGPTRWTLVYC
jgi:hypothetical protein